MLMVDGDDERGGDGCAAWDLFTLGRGRAWEVS